MIKKYVRVAAVKNQLLVSLKIKALKMVYSIIAAIVEKNHITKTKLKFLKNNSINVGQMGNLKYVPTLKTSQGKNLINLQL